MCLTSGARVFFLNPKINYSTIFYFFNVYILNYNPMSNLKTIFLVKIKVKLKDFKLRLNKKYILIARCGKILHHKENNTSSFCNLILLFRPQGYLPEYLPKFTRIFTCGMMTSRIILCHFELNISFFIYLLFNSHNFIFLFFFNVNLLVTYANKNISYFNSLNLSIYKIIYKIK